MSESSNEHYNPMLVNEVDDIYKDTLIQEHLRAQRSIGRSALRRRTTVIKVQTVMNDRIEELFGKRFNTETDGYIRQGLDNDSATED